MGQTLVADHQKRGYQIRRLRRPVYPDREVVPQLQCTIDRFGATGDGAGCSMLTFIRTGFIIGDIKSGAIPSGGKAQYEARCRLSDYILDKKIVEAPGCRNCPACLSETPLCFFDMPPLSWNFGVPRHVSACLRDNRRRH